MAQRTGNTFAKRQKEQQRQEKQHAKMQRRTQRKLEKQNLPPGPGLEPESNTDLFSAPENAASEPATNQG